jgi:hypothetical protein
MTDALGPFFESLAGQEVPGGCDQCDAIQVVTEATRGVWVLDIRHEDECPVLRVRKARMN